MSLPEPTPQSPQTALWPAATEPESAASSEPSATFSRPTPSMPLALSPGEDPWTALRAFTPARLALGRAGGSLRTASVLALRAAHAQARDAVHAAFDPALLARQLETHELATQQLATAAADRREYLLRPDKGRRLAEASRAHLRAAAPVWGRRDLAVMVSDGLAAEAALRHAEGVLVPLLSELTRAGWTLYPVLVVPLARVKLQDEVGELLGARLTLMLLGERPGLGVPDSLGAYFTHSPAAARTDAERNCVSNIRPAGLPPAEAARKLAHLLRESARLGYSGVQLKDTQPLVADAAGTV